MALHQLDTSWYHIQSGNKWTLPSPPALPISGWLGTSAGCQAWLWALLAGGMGMGVPRSVPVGTVAYRLLINVHTLPRWNHPVPSKAVGTWSNNTDSSPQGQVAHIKSNFSSTILSCWANTSHFLVLCQSLVYRFLLRDFLSIKVKLATWAFTFV